MSDVSWTSDLPGLYSSPSFYSDCDHPGSPLVDEAESVSVQYDLYDSCSEHRVLIVGCGVSGLEAVRTLSRRWKLKYGRLFITVLERQPRRTLRRDLNTRVLSLIRQEVPISRRFSEILPKFASPSRGVAISFYVDAAARLFEHRMLGVSGREYLFDYCIICSGSLVPSPTSRPGILTLDSFQATRDAHATVFTARSIAVLGDRRDAVEVCALLRRRKKSTKIHLVCSNPALAMDFENVTLSKALFHSLDKRDVRVHLDSAVYDIRPVRPLHQQILPTSVDSEAVVLSSSPLTPYRLSRPPACRMSVVLQNVVSGLTSELPVDCVIEMPIIAPRTGFLHPNMSGCIGMDGRVRVNRFLQLHSTQDDSYVLYPNIFVAGSVSMLGTDAEIPCTERSAYQGTRAAKNLIRMVQGRGLRSAKRKNQDVFIFLGRSAIRVESNTKHSRFRKSRSLRSLYDTRTSYFRG